jgi:hypothetical protein
VRPSAKMMNPGPRLAAEANKEDAPRARPLQDTTAPIRDAIAKTAEKRAELAKLYETQEQADTPTGAQRAMAPAAGKRPSLSALLAPAAQGGTEEVPQGDDDTPAAAPASPAPASPARRIQLLEARQRGLERYLEARKQNLGAVPERRSGAVPERRSGAVPERRSKKG